MICYHGVKMVLRWCYDGHIVCYGCIMHGGGMVMF
jgi:hypothetical protein